ncbi:MAG: tRNA 2-thiocytidine biosynthesis TtcA family protein [Clostridia bacterium]
MTEQELLSTLRKTITDFNLIEEGDNIGVGMSGGKDSLVLLALLKAYQRFCPQKFVLKAFTIDLGFDMNYSPIENFCKQIAVEYQVHKTQIAHVAQEKNAKNPCSLCANMRRGSLCELLSSQGYNKLALGHHADDAIDTMLLSLCYEGRFSTLAPISYMTRTNITVIRPLICIKEKDIISYAIDMPIVANKCPVDKLTKRQKMKEILNCLETSIPDIRNKVFGAIKNIDSYNLWDKSNQKYIDTKK